MPKITLSDAKGCYDKYIAEKHKLLNKPPANPVFHESKLCEINLKELKEYIAFIEDNCNEPVEKLGLHMYFGTNLQTDQLTTFMVPTIDDKGFVFSKISGQLQINKLEDLNGNPIPNERASILNRWVIKPPKDKGKLTEFDLL